MEVNLLFFTNSFGKNDGVFVIATGPRHKSHEHILTDGSLAILRSRCVSQNCSLFYFIPDIETDGLWWKMVNPLVRAKEINLYSLLFPLLSSTTILVLSETVTMPSSLAITNLPVSRKA